MKPSDFIGEARFARPGTRKKGVPAGDPESFTERERLRPGQTVRKPGCRQRDAVADCSVALVAELAMQLSGQHLPDYGAMRSRHDFTQRQLISCLVLRAYLNTTYRGILKLLGAMPDARDRMGLNAKLPHFTTLQKFGARRRITDIARLMVRTIGTATESGDAEPAPAPNGPERDKKRTRPVED